MDDSVVSGSEATAYKGFKKSLSDLGVRVLETSPNVMSEQGFSSDILIRIHDSSKNDRACLIGDRDPTNPLDPYSAVFHAGSCKQIDGWLAKVKALCNQIEGVES